MKIKTIVGLIQLTTQRKSHIIERHPIIEEYLENIRVVLGKPEEVRFSNYNENVLLFYRYFDNIEGGKYIVVVVNRSGKEVLTAYLSQRVKIGRVYELKL